MAPSNDAILSWTIRICTLVLGKRTSTAANSYIFNIPHDNVKACEGAFGKLRDNHMMSPTLIQIDRSQPWSVCSAAIITEFLDRGHGKGYREEQCEAFNGFSLNTNRLSSFVVWVPKFSGISPKDKCKLICRANGTGYFYMLAPKGRCIKAGCDGKLNSNKKFDKCVKNKHGKYLLNGNYVVSAVERDLLVRGSLLRYSGTSTAVETLLATRPLQEPLTVEVLSLGKMTPPRLHYSFYISRESKEEKTLHKEEHSQNSVLADSNKVEAKMPVQVKRLASQWATRRWDKCTVTCGNGLRKRMVWCRSAEGHPSVDCDSTGRPLPPLGSWTLVILL
ncbi:hypothetical protein CRUP_026973 [Coryphaenoides rupestris]|nr:hypothetical protein CRUP_026973 [Coryphaenoides rupestris]